MMSASSRGYENPRNPIDENEKIHHSEDLHSSKKEKHRPSLVRIRCFSDEKLGRSASTKVSADKNNGQRDVAQEYPAQMTNQRVFHTATESDSDFVAGPDSAFGCVKIAHVISGVAGAVVGGAVTSAVVAVCHNAGVGNTSAVDEEETQKKLTAAENLIQRARDAVDIMAVNVKKNPAEEFLNRNADGESMYVNKLFTEIPGHAFIKATIDKAKLWGPDRFYYQDENTNTSLDANGYVTRQRGGANMLAGFYMDIRDSEVQKAFAELKDNIAKLKDDLENNSS